MTSILSTSRPHRPTKQAGPPAAARLPGPDVTRAVALIGVALINYHGYLNGASAAASPGSTIAQRLFDPWRGVLGTRFAATFVLVAGIGVTLLTNRSRLSRDPVAVRDDRWRLARRGALLYGAGFVLNWIWPGTILVYYGAYFVIAALLFTLRARWIVLVGAAAAVAGAAIAWWGAVRVRDGRPADWLFNPQTLATRSPRGLVFDTFVNGTHPLFPWLAFLCLGILVGRMLPALPKVALITAGVLATSLSYIVSHLVRASSNDSVRDAVFSTRWGDRGLLYTVGTAGTALVAFCVISSAADTFRESIVTRSLLAAGRMTLTLYLLHVFVFRSLVDVLGAVRPTGLDTAVAFAVTFWVVAIIAATAWSDAFGQGPAERLYRHFGG